MRQVPGARTRTTEKACLAKKNLRDGLSPPTAVTRIIRPGEDRYHGGPLKESSFKRQRVHTYPKRRPSRETNPRTGPPAAAQRKRDEMAEVGVLGLHRTAPPDKTTPPSSARSSPLSNVSAQTRALGDKTFNTDGYGGVGLSIVDGSVSTGEERLKVAFMFPIKS